MLNPTNKKDLISIFSRNDLMIVKPFKIRLITARFLFLALLLLSTLQDYSQSPSLEKKIDPIFRQIIVQQKYKNLPNDKKALSHFRVEPTEGRASNNGTIEKKYECIVYTTHAQELRKVGVFINSVLTTFVTAWVTMDQIEKMADMDIVKYVEAPTSDYLHNDISVASTGASLLHEGKLNNTAYKGKNVLVAIYDSGIDWDHFDFRDPNDTSKSRIVRIWDQTLNALTGETPPATFSYGVEYTQAQINDELDGSPANVVREKDINGHGTHVAGIIAGNGSALPSKKYMGMAPEADLIVIKGGEGTFSTSRIIDGITYLQNLANTLGKPIVLNMSLGSQFGPHDGTRSYEIAVDNFTSSSPGRAVVISAGNDNGANLHNKMSLAANATTSISFVVPAGTTGTDVFQYRLYTKDNNAVSATITAPAAGGSLTANAGESKDGLVITDSFAVHLVNLVETPNNNRYVDLYVERNGTNRISPAGTWTLAITNNTTNTLAIDGWLYYKNTSFSSTSLVGGNSDYLVASPGNANSAITVASFAGRNTWYSNAAAGAYTFPTTRIDSISTFSSRGPRRDEVLKPEITANGEAVISCLSSNATSFANTSITDIGLYVKDQGTSMSAPVTAGAIALLFQANPAATISQIKNYITSTANKTAMTELTGATPNPTWGYGKLDVFKAATAMFNCSPAEHRTYKYDSSTRNAQETGAAFTTQRVAVRFTPDISGKLGGVYFNTFTTTTGLFIEVHTNNAGNPGTLLATINIDSARIGKYSWNYLDLSKLNITITNATDYFIVLGRIGTTGWSLSGEAVDVDGRSYQSLDNGVTWSVINTIDFKIRSDVFNDLQLSGILATVNSTDTRNINTSSQFINSNCALISQVVSSGANPVSGNVTSKVWLESSVQTYSGSPYVTRHYEITPTTGGATATGRITLYFTQAEFDAFNANPGSTLDLPANPTDNTGKANLQIVHYPGVSSNGSGLPGSYAGTPTTIDPVDTDIIWNEEVNRWEITFDVTGFSGFTVQTGATALPITLEYFRGESKSAENILSWKVNCGNSSAVFEIERSDDGSGFKKIGSVSVTQLRCSQSFNFSDALATEEKNYYRIKVVENTGRMYYTGIILLQSDNISMNALFPTVVHKGSAVQVRFTGNKGYLNISDGEGKRFMVTRLYMGLKVSACH